MDVDALLADYYEKCFGRAGGRMKEYFELWERIWRDRVTQLPWFRNSKGQYLAFSTCNYLECITEEDVAKARSLIDAALAEADTPGTRKRVEIMAKMFRFYELNCLTYLGQQKILDTAPATEKEAVALIDTAARTVDLQAERERYISEVLKKDPLFTPRLDFQARYGRLNWKSWGQSGFWVGVGFALNNPEGEAAQALRKVASGRSPAALAVRDVLQVMDRKGVKDLVQNGGFEEGTKSATGWNLWSRNGLGSTAPATDQTHGGKRSMRLTGIERGGPHQTLPVQFGKRYIAIAFAKGKLTPGSKGSAELLIGYRDAKRGYIKGLSGVSTKIRPPLNLWTPICVPFTVDDKRIGHVLLCPAANYLADDEIIWYDDVALYEFAK